MWYIPGNISLKKKKENSAICSNVDKHGEYYVKWNKPDTKSQISYVLIYTCNLKKSSSCKQKTEQLFPGPVDSGGIKEWWSSNDTKWENSSEQPNFFLEIFLTIFLHVNKWSKFPRVLFSWSSLFIFNNYLWWFSQYKWITI